jgi:hypothetical protein
MAKDWCGAAGGRGTAEGRSPVGSPLEGDLAQQIDATANASTAADPSAGG